MQNADDRPAPAAARRAVRATAMLAALAAVLAVGAVAFATAHGRENAEASPAGTVRGFLIDAVVDRNGVEACAYLTPGARRRLAATASPYARCPLASLSARLRLGGAAIDDESAVKRLDYRVEQHGAQALVTVGAGGAGMTFRLRRATAAELREFQAPPTDWRIDGGIDRLAVGA